MGNVDKTIHNECGQTGKNTTHVTVCVLSTVVWKSIKYYNNNSVLTCRQNHKLLRERENCCEDSQ